MDDFDLGDRKKSDIKSDLSSKLFSSSSFGKGADQEKKQSSTQSMKRIDSPQKKQSQQTLIR